MNWSTFRVEAGWGSLIVLLVSAFAVTKLYSAIIDFSMEVDIQSTNIAQLKTIPESQRVLIAQWIRENSIEVPTGKGYRYIINTYPEKPWLDQ